MRKIFFLFVFMAAFLVSCSGFAPSFDRETFALERQLWLEQDIQDYSFKAGVEWTDDGVPDTTVFVQNGSVKYFWVYLPGIQTPGGYGPAYLFSYPFRISISEIYAELERFGNNGNYKVDVQYHSVLHYPTHIECWRSSHEYSFLSIRDFVLNPELPGV
jgi:hypothetical protein